MPPNRYRKQHIFLVHGIGKHGDEWSKPWETAFLDTIKKYSPFREMSDDETKETFNFIPISYDGVFESFREQWSNLSKAVTDVSSNSTDLEFLDFLEHLRSSEPESDFEKFFWENLIDVALWYGFEIARKRVVASVVKQLADALRDNLADDGSNFSAFHVIAHSLGTSVIHDSLVGLSQSAPTRDAYGTDIFRFQTLTTVSNVSAVMESPFVLDRNLGTKAHKVYHSVVRPSHLKSESCVCRNFINARHELDPITWPRMFQPLNLAENLWREPNYALVQEGRFVDIAQVHDFRHYLASPDVHIRLFRNIVGQEVGTVDEVKESLKKWQERTKDGGPAAQKVRALFTSDRVAPWTLKDLIDLIKKAGEVVKIRKSGNE